MADCTKNDRRGIGSGVIILGIGLYFLAVNHGYLPPVSMSWPLLLVVFGLGLIFGNLFRKRTPDSNPPPPPGR